MPDLNFTVEKAEAVPYSASPLLNFSLRISNDELGAQAETIHTVALRCQIRLEPTKRRYEPREQEQLLDLFGQPSRWGQTLRAMLWTHTSLVVPTFTGSTLVELPVPCTFDFNVAAAKYFYALQDGDVPLCLLFSGTVFFATDEGLQVMQIPWEKEAGFRLPVRVWKQMMEMYYPNSAWLCLRKDAFDQLYQYKSRRGLPTWEQAIEELLAQVDEQVGT
jgi:hypothetical protein